MTKQTRRTFVRSGTAATGMLVAGPGLLLPTSAAAKCTETGSVFSKYFKWEVKGISGNVPGVTSVDIGRLTVTVEESTRGDQPEFEYGKASYADTTFTMQQLENEESKAVFDWATTAANSGGRDMRRDCSLYYLARDQKAIMRIVHLRGCLPVSVSEARGDRSNSNIKEITFTVNVDRIEEAQG